MFADLKTATGAAIVGAAMVALFLLPARYFVPATFMVTAFMMGTAFWVGGYARVPKPTVAAVVLGLASAGVLYAVFFAGNWAIMTFQFPGIGRSNANAIYALIASPSSPLALQVAVLAFDAVGYESFFRGVLQRKLQPRLGVGAAPAVAALDAALHLATFNPLWVATTFIADLVWGLTYYRANNLTASLTSHFVWDLAIFIVRPIT